MTEVTGRCRVLSATLRGVEAVPVEVEVSVSKGMPGFFIVGMPDISIQESKERIRAALNSCGFRMPSLRIVANLAPSSIKKSGSGFDLPIAMAILGATKQVDNRYFGEYLTVGELSLNGQVREVPGLLAYAMCARDMGRNILSADSRNQCVSIDGVVQEWISGLADLRTKNFKKAKFYDLEQKEVDLDFRDISGHDIAKRALQIAACGNHGVLMVGPPGSGKTMLASRMPSILPPLTEKERMESAVIHSIAGEDVTEILNGIRPFRSPHHSATLPGLIGGGNPMKPGEVSLAHQGVLYLDELAEFKPNVLQGIRQPLESGTVTITRADGAVTFPAKFSLLASSNPCPCGYYGDKDQECRCTPNQILHYQNRIGGPVLDRIDMHLDVERISASSVLDTGNGTDSETLLNGVLTGMEFREWRFRHQTDIRNENVIDECINKKLNSFKKQAGKMERLVTSCNLSDNDFRFFEEVAQDNKISGRGIMRVLSVSRTIADIEQSESVKHEHLCEALAYRVREKSQYL